MASQSEAHSNVPLTKPSQAAHSSKNPFKKIIGYMQNSAEKAAEQRWEGGSYLTPPGKEPQQRYPRKSKSGKSDQQTEAAPTEESN